MPRKSPSVNRYVVRLEPEERERLEGMLRKGKHRAQALTKARILLMADVSEVGEGLSDGRIIEALGTNASTVHRTRKQLVEEGLAAAMRIFLCGDVMTGRGLDQALPHPCSPVLHESYAESALDYMRLAERANGPIPRPVDFAYVWGVALEEWHRAQPHARIFNLETSITRNEVFEPKGINYRMSPDNAGCLTAAGVDCCVLANNHILDWGPAGLIDPLKVLTVADQD